MNSNKVVYWKNSNKSYVTLHKQHVYQPYMLTSNYFIQDESSHKEWGAFCDTYFIWRNSIS